MLHVELESVEFDEVGMRKRHRVLCFFAWIYLDLALNFLNRCGGS
ncbi:hypothetical protein MtrunA17_Chr1g0171621 [Medicago truncatula]|uniref:Uncharacterized protein n=1 Tax=Medicago truncatula TaxID=3880 RepID=A0A396JP26_MEDTR|nr:hypothetical protein MtrunA17_Chr1g0171621 [Medicago truncatula]